MVQDATLKSLSGLRIADSSRPLIVLLPVVLAVQVVSGPEEDLAAATRWSSHLPPTFEQ